MNERAKTKNFIFLNKKQFSSCLANLLLQNTETIKFQHTQKKKTTLLIT